jgi:hypothetical protein
VLEEQDGGNGKQGEGGTGEGAASPCSGERGPGKDSFPARYNGGPTSAGGMRERGSVGQPLVNAGFHAFGRLGVAQGREDLIDCFFGMVVFKPHNSSLNL